MNGEYRQQDFEEETAFIAVGNPRQRSPRKSSPSRIPRALQRSQSDIPVPVDSPRAPYLRAQTTLNSTFTYDDDKESTLNNTFTFDDVERNAGQNLNNTYTFENGDQNTKLVSEKPPPHFAKSKGSTKRKKERKPKGSDNLTTSGDSYTKISTKRPDGDNVSFKSTGTYTLSPKSRMKNQNDPPHHLPPLANMHRQMTMESRYSDNESVRSLRSAPKLHFKLARAYVDLDESSKLLPGLDKKSTAKFIRKNIKQRECDRYVVDPGSKSPGYCFCGRDEEWHTIITETPDQENRDKTEWSPKKDTVAIPCDTFGEIVFAGASKESATKAPYVRVDTRSKLDSIWTLLDDYWQLPPPRLIISVTGGAKKFNLRHRLLKCFKTGLINAATQIGAWIITGGTNAGVMKYVGEAVKEHSQVHQGSSDEGQMVALGIATWGIVDNKEVLEADEGLEDEGKFPAYYKPTYCKPNTSPLDPNHTHFIFVDDGTECKWGREIKLRAKLEQYISKKVKTGISEDLDVAVPVVQLLLEGGPGSLQTAAESMAEGTPVVVVRGSGRAADLLAHVNKFAEKKKNTDLTQHEQYLKDRILEYQLFDASRMSAQKKEEQLKSCLDWIYQILNHRKLLTVFHLNDSSTTNDIDRSMLHALLKAKTEKETQLNLALAWNRPDIAEQKIFTEESRGEWKNIDFSKAMETALCTDRVEFVKLFLEVVGIEPEDFLTREKLKRMYNKVLNDKFNGVSANFLKQLLGNKQNVVTGCCVGCCSCCKSDTDDTNMELQVVGDFLVNLMGDHNHNRYVPKKHSSPYDMPDGLQGQDSYCMDMEDDNKSVKMKKMMQDRSRWRKTQMKSKTISRKVQHEFEDPELELFLWAVLLNRRELAQLFWRMGKDHISTAQYANAILMKMSKKADSAEETDLSSDLEMHAREFEARAVGVLSECYTKDKAIGHRLCVRALPQWGNETLMTLADQSNQMQFMEQDCCQTKLNEIWRGQMAVHTSMIKIIFSMIFPFLVFTMNFRPESRPIMKSSTDSSSANINGSQKRVSPLDEEEDSDPDGDGVEFHRSKTRRLGKKPQTLKAHHMASVTIGRGQGTTRSTLNPFKALVYYYTAPVTKFLFHQLTYVVFLGLFSFFILTDLHPLSVKTPGIYEYLVWGWVFTLVVEEIRQILTRDPRSLRFKLLEWYSSIWNQFDLFLYAMFCLAVVLRLTLHGEKFEYARAAYALTVGGFYVRLMQAFFVNKNVGPKVVMIQKMLNDVVFFLVILLLFVLAFGVLTQTMLYPNSAVTFDLIIDILYKPYWQMYGELFLEEVTGDVENCGANHSSFAHHHYNEEKRCPQHTDLVPIFLGIYMLFTNVLLLNLLIAMFSYTFQKVQDNSETFWRFYRFSLIYEYNDRPTLAPPLIIISHLIRIIIWFYKCMSCKSVNLVKDNFREFLSKDEIESLQAYEKIAMEKYVRKTAHESISNIDNRVISAGERIEKVIEDLDEIKEQVLAYENDEFGGETVTLSRPLRDVTDGASSKESVLTSQDMQELERKLEDMMERMMTKMMDAKTASATKL